MAVHDIRQQAQELSYVLLKICSYIQKEELAQRIERLSYEFVQNIYVADVQKARMNLEGLIGLLALASNTTQISTNNSALLIERCGQLKANIEAEYQLQEPERLTGAFQRQKFAIPEKEPFALPKSLQSGFDLADRAAKKEASLIRTALSKENQGKLVQPQYGNNPARKRQERIMEILRQSEDTQMQLRDFVLKIPEVSERTIRYDLEKLVKVGKIQRRGSGGPSNYYVLA